MPVTCYICGRDFGTKSIKIHIPNCEKKWDNEQEKLPKKERRPVPQAPQNFDKVLSGEISAPKQLQEYNEQAFNDFNTKSLQECPNCGRTFLPKPLEIHSRSCKPKETRLKPAAPRKSKRSQDRRNDPSPRPETLKTKTPPTPDHSDLHTPTKEELIELIQRDKTFDSPQMRRKLMARIQDLIL
ncbi:hypothetical protein TCAL_00666 [Tigriopus californicus]|uniref:C2HC/C3H-type domain-containing protein n=1 Tax=Tigriopus californicus TaxID=6832 RepID=A0A553PBS7_TIGCA|nr:zinc finger protein 474-like [Tigriopus californicus]TRY75134.1 hypothetical protein TCAL_00666 [Tigriopus californicus]|eukprot:TCALIF_00666-PA protein Name:"Similar to Znf474 Zinc finger protein 474 (Mus musculus)" AED:0.16 eAED:0.16 QI:0/-1/0/1/-1/1/1/0/183